MTSQSPTEEEEIQTDPYLQSWQAMTHMIMEEGLSWSGREKNCAYFNVGAGRFAGVSASTDANYPDDARALALIDWDGDGALDLVLKNRTAPRLRLLRNQSGEGTHWVQFKLVGTGASNRDAIGSRVRVERDGHSPLLAGVRAGDGYLSQSSRMVHFGLGASADPVDVEVRWPDGSVERFEGLAVDAHWRLVQGSGEAAAMDVPHASGMASLPTGDPARNSSEERRIVLVDRLPMAPFALPSYQDEARTVADFAGKPLLVNLWATTCANCYTELGEFAEHRDRLAAAGLQVVPLSTDPPELQDKAREVIADLGHAELAGPTSPEQFETLQLLFREMLGERAPSLLPSSLLLDAQGRVCVVYQGPVSVEQLEADLARLAASRAGSRWTDRLADGRWLAERKRDFAGLAAGLREQGADELAAFYADLAAADRGSR